MCFIITTNVCFVARDAEFCAELSACHIMRPFGNLHRCVIWTRETEKGRTENKVEGIKGEVEVEQAERQVK